MAERKRVAILISGRGSNMAALIDAAAERDFPAEIVAVISDDPDAIGIGVAASKGIMIRALVRKDFDSKQDHDAAIDAVLKGLKIDIICLAGYMRLLTRGFVSAWQGRMINIHPALLPLFKGLDTHRRALEAGVRLHGCSVHFVTAATDDGPIIAQGAVPVFTEDTEDTLATRVLKAEHHIFPVALRMLAQGDVRMEGGRAIFAGARIKRPHANAVLFSPEYSDSALDLESLARFTP